MSHWMALIVAALANAAANVALKSGMQQVKMNAFDNQILAVAGNQRIWLGLVAAGLLLCSYLYAIREIEVSVAYPIVTGAAMVGIAILAMWLLNEPIGPRKWIGIALVVSGIAFLSEGKLG